MKEMLHGKCRLSFMSEHDKHIEQFVCFDLKELF